MFDIWQPAAYVIGLHNEWLQWPFALDAVAYQAILARTPASYIFKQVSSVAIRIRPGESSDTRYDTMPAGTGG